MTGVLRSHGSQHGGCRQGNRVDLVTCELMPRFQTLCKNEWKMTAPRRFEMMCIIRCEMETQTQTSCDTSKHAGLTAVFLMNLSQLIVPLIFQHLF